jgi:2-dehydropantoate 2-reductase
LRFAIVGAGAIGCLYGARLALAGHVVTLIHRDNSIVRAIQKNGVSLRETNEKLVKVRVHALRGPTVPSGTECLIIAVKAYDTVTVVDSYRRIIPLETRILSLQNGLGNIEALESGLKRPIIAGSTSDGAFSLGPGRVAHTGKGSTIIGHATGKLSEGFQIKDALNEAGFRTRINSNIRGVLWTKAIVNAAINPLSGLTRLPNGALADNAVMREIGSTVVSEGIAVSRACGINLVGNPRRLWRKILLSTRTNESSMLQDIMRGRMTEIRQLNGAIVAYGKKVGIKTPTNEILTKLVLALETSQDRGSTRYS